MTATNRGIGVRQSVVWCPPESSSPQAVRLRAHASLLARQVWTGEVAAGVAQAALRGPWDQLAAIRSPCLRIYLSHPPRRISRRGAVIVGPTLVYRGDRGWGFADWAWGHRAPWTDALHYFYMVGASTAAVLGIPARGARLDGRLFLFPEGGELRRVLRGEEIRRGNRLARSGCLALWEARRATWGPQVEP